MGTSIKSRHSVIVRRTLAILQAMKDVHLSLPLPLSFTLALQWSCATQGRVPWLGNAGKRGAEIKSSQTMALIPPPMPSQRDPLKVDVEAPNTTSLFDIQCAVGLLGRFTRFEADSELENPPINLYSVTHEKLQSAQFATGFAKGPISFHPAQPYLQVDALLHLGPTVAEENRAAEARTTSPTTRSIRHSCTHAAAVRD